MARTSKPTNCNARPNRRWIPANGSISPTTATPT